MAAECGGTSARFDPAGVTQYRRASLRGGLPGHPRPARIEGDPRLLNRYDVILLDPIKHPEAKQQPAHRFADWLVSPEGQAAIDAYKINGEQLFHPSADAPK